MNWKMNLILGMALSLPMIVRAEDQVAKNEDASTRARLGEIREETRFHKIVDQSTEVYAAIAKGNQREVPPSVLKKARCIAVLPEVMTGALVVGGSHGNGVVSCLDSNNAWSQPAPISINQGSIGLQAGVKSADVVLYFQSQEAVRALKSGKFQLGTDVSAVAGNYDASVDTSSAAVVVYTRAEGLFAGASVNGGKISQDEDVLASYYGKKTEFAALLEGRESPDSTNYAKKLTSLFPS